jgi:hypothetical protein
LKICEAWRPMVTATLDQIAPQVMELIHVHIATS